MLHVVGIKNCNTIKKTLDWLEEEGIDYSFQDVKKTPLNRDEVLDLVSKLSLETIINKRGTKWRSLNVSADISEKDLFELVLEHQTMIKRPVLVKGEAVMVGFDPDSIESFLED